MELTLDRCLVTDYEDSTASSRPPREALTPAEPHGLYARLMSMPPLDEEEDVVPRAVEMLPFVAAWGD